MKKDPVVYLEHILESCRQVLEYTSKVTNTDFKHSQQIQDAVLRRLEIIGEAAKQLPNISEIKNRPCPGDKLPVCATN